MGLQMMLLAQVSTCLALFFMLESTTAKYGGRYLNGERVESVTPIKSIEEVKNMQEIISMLPIETIEEVVSMEEVKYIEEIKEGIARKFIEDHNLENMLDENGNRKKYKSNSDRGDDFTYEEEDCKELLEDFERTEVEIAIVESVLEDHCSAKKYPDTGAGKYGEEDEIREGQSLSEIRGRASVTPIESIEEVKKITPIKSIEEVKKMTPIKSIKEVKHVYPLTDRQAQLLREQVEEASSSKYGRRRRRRRRRM